ncbi:hypothetical protein, partial [Hymenobacter terricola]|uniref:hypothetical protein n=1 Tax=Hymenobacter terricola TaxID=2819236 RepID=UPI001B30BCAC
SPVTVYPAVGTGNPIALQPGETLLLSYTYRNQRSSDQAGSAIQWVVVARGSNAGSVSGGSGNVSAAAALASGQLVVGAGGSAVASAPAFTITGAELAAVCEAPVAPRGLTIAQHNDGPQAAYQLVRKSRGSAAAPTAVQAGDLIGLTGYSSYSGGAWASDRTSFGAIYEGSGGQCLAFITGSTDGNYAPSLRVAANKRVAVGDFGTAIPYTLQSVPEQLSVNGRAFLANQSEPATPAGGGTLYVENGTLKFKGSNGTVTVIAPA